MLNEPKGPSRQRGGTRNELSQLTASARVDCGSMSGEAGRVAMCAGKLMVTCDGTIDRRAF